MKSDFEQDFKDLHDAALRLSTKMVAAMQSGEIESLDKATRAGAIVLMQLGPLPACQRVELVLREREGAMHTLAAIGANYAD